MRLVMTGGTRGCWTVTYRCKNLKEDHGKVTSEYNQEVRSSVPNYSVEKTRHALNAHATLTFRRVYDNEEGQAIFSKKGLAFTMCTLNWGSGRTIHQRKRGMDNLACWPSLEGTDPEPIEWDVGECHRYWNRVCL